MKVLLADDENKVRSALRLLLEQEPDVEVVGEASESVDLVGKLEVTQPDVVLLDWELPGLPAMELLPTLRDLYPQLRIIVLSGRPEAQQMAFEAGVDGFVSKGDPPERLLATMHSLGAGGIRP